MNDLPELMSIPLARRVVAGAALTLAGAPIFASGGAATFKGPQMDSAPGQHDFAFQTGHWRTHHRKLRQRLAGSTDWVEFGGTCDAWEIMGGAGNLDDHFLDDPAGAYRAATFRRIDPDTGEWLIWWADGRRAGLDDPMRGAFNNGKGTFFGKDVLDGRPIDVRFFWTCDDPDRPRWEQAFSADGQRSWETNWIMTFSRSDR